MLLFSTLLCVPARAAWTPRIVNGSPTPDFPAAALVILYTSSSRSAVSGRCSGTLIGCHTVVTAGHCVCDESADNYESCLAAGIVPPGRIEVFLPNAGVLPVAQVFLHPAYEFGVRGDLAVLVLQEAVDGVAPVPLNDQPPALGSEALVIGYGTTRGGLRAVDDTGIKRFGTVVLDECPTDVPSATNLCWNFSGAGSNTCGGDSGGGLYVSRAANYLLAGVVSGGSSFDCQAPDQSFATSVAAHRSWIAETAGPDLGRACSSRGLVHEPPNQVVSWQATLSAASPEAEWQVAVPEGAQELVVTFNGQTATSGPFMQLNNDFDLFVRPTQSLPDVWACQDPNPNNWGSCRVTAPIPGPWTVRIRRVQGEGQIQATATVFAAPKPCSADCNQDGAVDVAELVRAVSIALGENPVSVCRAADPNNDGEVTVDEIIRGVESALNGCL